MKWTYSIQNKTKIIFWSTLILILVFAKNWIDNNNVTTLDHSFSSVYDDRLVAESYIFLLSDHLYQKKITVSSCASNVTPLTKKLIDYHNTAIQTLIKDYETTQLTKTESFYLQQLKQNLTAIEVLESDVISQPADTENSSGDLQNRYETAMLDLNQLSKIQLAEGKILKEQSKQIAAGSTLLTQFELTIIVAIALFIQVLVFSTKGSVPIAYQKYNLN